jgi:hypothetical protein
MHDGAEGGSGVAMLIRGQSGGGSDVSPWASNLPTVSIVLLVLILGGAAYLWYMRYLRSRAVLITLVAVVALLVYFGFFAAVPPT